MSDNLPTPASSAIDQLQAMGGGLSQFDGSEAGTPRIKIKGRTTTFEDTSSGLEVPEFTGIILGAVRGRVLWPAEMSEDGDSPLCKSKNFEQGRPFQKEFPWLDAGLVAPEAVTPNYEVDCGSCRLQHFGTHPKHDNKPWCTEQTTIIVMADLDKSGTYLPSLLTVQSSGLKPTHRFFGDLARRSVQAYTFHTKVGLEARKFAGNPYAVPTFQRLEPTPAEEWEVYAQNYLSMFSWLTTWQDEASEGTAVQVTPHDNIPDF